MGTDKVKKQMEESRQLLFKKGRLETFKSNWKEMKGFKYCTPENFAEAGFYNYSSNKYSDNVKCFACQKELSDWEKNDDPWQEHVKRGTKCPFVIFKSKKNTTIQDFLELHFEIKKILLNNYFESKKEILQEKEKFLLKNFANLRKGKK